MCTSRLLLSPAPYALASWCCYPRGVHLAQSHTSDSCAQRSLTRSARSGLLGGSPRASAPQMEPASGLPATLAALLQFLSASSSGCDRRPTPVCMLYLIRTPGCPLFCPLLASDSLLQIHLELEIGSSMRKTYMKLCSGREPRCCHLTAFPPTLIISPQHRRKAEGRAGEARVGEHRTVFGEHAGGLRRA